MTAIVGVLNKHAIAIAADSAETIGAGIKIYNKANKIFTLSKHHPIGIAIYSSAAFNGLIPWEIVIKMFRSQLGSTSYDTVQDYASAFFAFLEDYKNEYIKKEELDAVLCAEISQFWISEIIQKLPNSTLEKGDLNDLITLLNDIKRRALQTDKVDKIKAVTLEDFKSSIRISLLKPIIDQIVSAGGKRKDFEELISETLFEVFSRTYIQRTQYTGIAFFGYGEKEIFPVLYQSLIFNCFAGVMYWEEKEIDKISNTKPDAFICPMAQTDVMTTYITGISPLIENTFIKSTIEAIKLILDNIRSIVTPINKGLASAIGQIDINPIIQSYVNGITLFKNENTISPLMQTIATMEKEDLAELAENLIYLTSLKRRITPDMESVGGPVDVAIVSKGDGFIWIKRKHYFDPALNRCYFDTYFENENKQQ
ncbi:MAG: hypothetical protein IJ202_08895 [Bacteroidales bacterium]|nr:hypothetical protein [Bacteroidales bacterium]